MLFKCNIFHGDLHCSIKYSNVEYQDLSLKAILKSKWLDLILNVNFMTLTNLNLIFIFHIP